MNAKRIAMFVDVDNCALEYLHYENVLSQVKAEGDVVYGKLYGLSDKKHKEILQDAEANGFETCRAMRIKKRGAKVFDNRIAIDVVTTVFTMDIDAVAIVCAPADMVYLYSFLRKNGVEVYACDNADEPSMGFVDVTIDLGKVEEIKLPKTRKAPAVTKKTETDAESVAAPETTPEESVHSIVDEAQELLRQIEQLRKEEQQFAEQHAETPVQTQAEETAVAQVEESAESEQAEQTEQTSPVETAVAEETPLQTEEVAQPIEQPQQPAQTQVDADQENDDDLIRKIEQLRSQNNDDDTELVDKIKRILDGVDD